MICRLDDQMCCGLRTAVWVPNDLWEMKNVALPNAAVVQSSVH